MLISPPFLPTRQANETDEAWLSRALIEARGEGMYPVGNKLCWHGGVHLEAPEENRNRLRVRAIADGTVVFARAGEATRSDDPAHVLNYNGWTSNGVVVLEHNTEIGATAEGVATSVRFYSIYMHLTDIPRSVRAGQSIHRKAEIGQAGYIEGQPNCMHFEIRCDTENLGRLAGRTTGDLATHRDGRSDAVFGEIYFHLPQGTPVYDQCPLDNNPFAQAQPPRPTRQSPLLPPVPLNPAASTEIPCIIGMRFATGDGAAEVRGNMLATTYREDGSECGRHNNPAYEYQLYARAKQISDSYPAATRPAMSAVYELLRFGRVINTAHETLNPAHVPHWQQIVIPLAQGTGTQTGWVNLNAQGMEMTVRKFSDADFPHWKGWQFIEDDTAATDSRCDSATMKALLDIDGDMHVSPAERRTRMAEPAINAKLRKTICAIPLDWNAASLQARWAWLQQVTPENPEALDAESFAGFTSNAEALCFTAPALQNASWCFHPRAFIEMFRRCGWLRSEDLRRIYPNTAEDIRERYRLALNQVLRRYGMVTPRRAAHFFGQGFVETMGLRLMVEGSVSFSRNPAHASFQPEVNNYYQDPRDLYGYFHNYERSGNDLGNVARSDLRDNLGNSLPVVIGRDAQRRPYITSPVATQIDSARSRVGDGMKFRGRGFKQLTGLSNYTQYWTFRGWLRAGVDYDESWWSPPRRPTDPAKRPPQIADPQRISNNPFNCIDSGGQFAIRNGVPRQADGGVARQNSDNVSRIVNRWDEPSFERRFNGMVAAYEIVGP
ncbi:hypothetical protein [Chitinimonas taiwanensis]|uniref:hypothetical protein n=1 Tax=Chitinimonas taiwanensis TaxID=240412 RepID=UPI0035B0C06D